MAAAAVAAAMMGCSSSIRSAGAPSDAQALTQALQRTVVDVSARVPDAPAVMLHVDAPRLGVSWSGAAHQGRWAPQRAERTVRIASNTKTFVAATVLVLSERGVVGLDDTIERWLQPGTTAALTASGYDTRAITVRMLLQHTSGLRDHSILAIYLQRIREETDHRWTRREQVELALRDGPPLAEPGRRFHYSDTGYVLLGEVVEQALRIGLPQAVRDTLDLQRLKLRHTWFESLEPPPPDAPARAVQLLEGVNIRRYDASIDLYGGGGLASTLADLARFQRAVVRGEVFTDRQTAATMQQASAASREVSGGGYGMGLSRIEHAGVVCFGHGGYWGTDAWHCPTIDLTLAAAVTSTEGRAALRAMSMEVIRLGAEAMAVR